MAVTSGTEIAFKWPMTAARTVVRCHELGGDVQNAWDVLVSAWGEERSRLLLNQAATDLGYKLGTEGFLPELKESK